ncbi:Crp/Fnr family transcriptional regulator [Sphingomonas sp.]|uniref:Crp/Fnr family transcriptional regulator n=1 Tax=Sphingomonas sp. TaxID=28214 RepID=UPI003CC51659
MAQWLVNIGRRDARSRMAHFLCELASRYRMMDQSDGRAVRLPMSQEQIGNALGLTAVHVNRTLGGLRTDNLVSFEHGQLTVLDPHGLARAGDFDAAYLSENEPPR